MDCVLSVDVGRKNLALCCVRPGADAHGRDDVVRHWVVTSTLPSCHSLVDTLRAAGVPDWLPCVREVVVERQPGKNTPMVRLQCYLEMYFAMQGKPVALADPCHKLSFAAAGPFWRGGVPTSWSYYTRKKLAVQTTEAFLEGTGQDEHVRATFERSQKKDDLSDSLLQGMAYAHFVAPLHNARAEAKRARVPAPRRPSEQQLASGKLAKSHVVSLLVRGGEEVTEEGVEAACVACRPLRKAIAKHFGSAEFCVRVMREWQAAREAAREGARDPAAAAATRPSSTAAPDAPAAASAGPSPS